MNPGGSLKDRLAKGILKTAKRNGSFLNNNKIYEGTSGKLLYC